MAEYRTCNWCLRIVPASMFTCMNTRDMEDFALEDDQCYAALQRAGGGEKGLAYIDANRKPKPTSQEPT